MLSWAVTFLLIALLAAVGVGGIAGTDVDIAKILFFVSLVLFAKALVIGRRTVPALECQRTARHFHPEAEAT